jgi:WD40 repeat protein
MTGDGNAESSASNPYPGPRPFKAGEKLYGRDFEVTRLFYLLSAERIVVLHSPSGAGKSSLFNAGLLPRLRAERFYVWPTIRLSEDPADGSNRFVRSAVSSLEEGLPEQLRRPASELARLTLRDYVAGRPRHPEAPAPVVLVFDQFEEILTLDPLAVDAKREFFRQLGEALENTGVWALLALREDYLGALDPYRNDVPTRLGNTFRLDLLTVDAAEEAIAGPAHDAGREFEPGAALALANDLATVSVQQPDGRSEQRTGIYVEPLLLQLACTRLWALTVGARTITKDNLPESGDVDAALVAYYDRSVGEVAGGSVPAERAVRDWFGRQLITRDGIRNQVRREPGASGGLDNDSIDRLVETHLIRAESRVERTWFELAHDRLVAPIRSSNAAWLDEHLHPMQRQAELWKDQGAPERLLLRGRDLKDAQRWARENAASVSTVEAEFLERSHQQEQTERRRRIMVAALIVGVLVVAAVIGLLALKARNEHENAQRAARTDQSMALAAGVPELLRGRLDDAMRLSLEALDRSDSIDARKAVLAAVQRTDGLVRFLRFSQQVNSLAVARNGTIAVALDGGKVALLDRSGRNIRQTLISTKHLDVDAVASDPVRPLLAAAFANEVELFRAGPDHALERVGTSKTTRQGKTSSITFSDDGGWLAAAGIGGVTLWRVDAGGHARAVPLRGATSDVTALAFTGLKPRLVASDAHGLLAWDLRRPGSMPRRIELGSAGALAVGAGGGAVADRGRVALWRGPPTARLERVDRVGGSPTALAFDQTGTLLAVGDGNGRVALWGVKERQPVGAPFLGQGGRIVSLAFEHGSSVLAVGSADHTVALWDTKSRVRALRVSEAFGGDVANAIFSRNAILAVVTANGKVKAGDLGWPPNVRAVRQRPVYALVASPDGRRIVAVESSGALAALDSRMEPSRVLPPRYSKYASVADDGSGVAVNGEGGSVQLWQPAGQAVEQLEPPNSAWLSPLPVAISADGHTVAAYYSGPRKIVVWRLSADGGAKSSVLGSPGPNVNDLAFSPDGTALVSANGNGTIERWQVGKQGTPTELPAGPAGPATLAFSPDGRILASVGADQLVRLWAVQNGLAELGTLPLSRVTSVAFSPDGRWLVAVQDGKVRVWDATLWAQTAAGLDRVRQRFREALWCDPGASCH